VSFNFVPSDEVAKIRRSIDHPIIDGDGHQLEFFPLVRELLVEAAGADVARSFDTWISQRHSFGPGFPPIRQFDALPSENTLDRMTLSLPELLYRRLDEIGIDFALLYPSTGLRAIACADAEVRQATCHALNESYVQLYAGYRDRLEPVAVIPTFTPDEAIAELEHAVVELGLKTVVMNGIIPRLTEQDGTTVPWIDSLGHNSVHDYDPLWARCIELGVAPAFHGVGYGMGTRVSATNYVHNHLGNFAAAQEAVCRSLIMGGVPRRFPQLRVALLEGGVAWAAQLYADLLGHYDKRNADAVAIYNPSRLDLELCHTLLAEFGRGPITERADAFESSFARLKADGRQPAADLAVESTDDFAEALITDPAQIVEVFTRQFNFGFEADDPLNSLAFDTAALPGHVRLNALFASDIGHWDVPDIREVLPEAYEMVEDGHLDKDDFRDFTCSNVARMLTDANPRFFDGTVLEGRQLT
jgi:predicted TIM-barrel fold metal-dependent hydrolase